MADLQAKMALFERFMKYVEKTPEYSRFLQTDDTPWKADSGDTAWMLTSTMLVLLMTIPGLALFYGGMVRVNNVLATAMQCLSITALVTFLWQCVGYSIAFAPVDQVRDHAFIGDSSRMWLLGVDMKSYHQNAPTIPESVFCMFQLTFAIITPAVICGSFAERMKYESMLVFMALWHIFTYCPLAHCVWHPEGFLFKTGLLDYAGGCVVEIPSGVAGLVSSYMVGHRVGFGIERFEPHNILLTFMGASLLWVGWFGFNAGSAGFSGDRTGLAMLTSQIAAAMASLTWMFTEWFIRKKSSLLGMMSGSIAGLVAITPACGYVDTTGAFVIGFLAGPFCYGGIQLKHYCGFDDALDAFGVHAIGALFGTLMTGLFARAHICGLNGWLYGNGNQFVCQIYGVLFAVGYTAVTTYLELKLIDMTLGLRVSAQHEAEGLDVSIHGESIVDTGGKKLDGSAHSRESNNGSTQDKSAEGGGTAGKDLAAFTDPIYGVNL